MKIISTYKDFYDGVMSLDQDRELIYHRKLSEVPYHEKPGRPFPVAPGMTSYVNHPHILGVSEFVVGFCGKTYFILKLQKTGKPPAFAFSLADVDRYVEANFKPECVEAYQSKKPDSKLWLSDRGRKSFEKFWTETEQKRDDFQFIFDEHKVPIWVYQFGRRTSVLVLNAPLKPLGFESHVDPWTAYQELCMYWGGVAQPLKEIPQMNDEIKADASGHGGKYSFRKPPRIKS